MSSYTSSVSDKKVIKFYTLITKFIVKNVHIHTDNKQIYIFSIRGTLSAMIILSVNIGVLIGFILSSHLDYHLIPFLAICLPIIYLIGTYLFPETPQHLLRKKKYSDAEKSFQFYQNYSSSNETKSENTFDNLKLNIENSKQQISLSYRDFGK